MPDAISSFLATYNAAIVFVAINGVLAYSMYAVLIAGQLSLAQAAFASIAAYTSAVLSIELGWPFWAVVLAGIAVGALVAFVLGLPVLRLRGVFLAIATLGFGEMVRIVALNLDVTGGAQGLRGIPKVVTTWQAYLALGACAWFFWRLRPTRLGRGLAALRQDETAASAMGIDVVRYKLFAFTVSGAMAGLSGVLYAHFTRFIAPGQFGFERAVDALLYAIVGGTGNWIGPLLGGGLLTVLPEFQRQIGIEAGWLRPFLNGFILLGIILFLPAGLAGLGSRLRSGRAPQRTGPPGQRSPDEAPQTTSREADGAHDRSAVPSVVLHGLTKDYGGVRAVDNVDLEISTGAVMGLIGPNGAGKTTLVNALTGVAPASAGEVQVLGQRLDGMKAHRVASMGVARTFQQIKLFDGLSAMENVLVGGHRVARSTFLRRLLLLPSARLDERRDLEAAARYLDKVGLSASAAVAAGNLAYGDRRRLEIARALCSEPDLLVLDEPAAGMNRVEAESLGALITAIAAQGVTILLIEHNVWLVMRTCTRVAVLDFGRLIAEGEPAQVARDPEVVRAYLGTSASDGAAGPSETGSRATPGAEQ